VRGGGHVVTATVLAVAFVGFGRRLGELDSQIRDQADRGDHDQSPSQPSLGSLCWTVAWQYPSRRSIGTTVRRLERSFAKNQGKVEAVEPRPAGEGS